MKVIFIKIVFLIFCFINSLFANEYNYIEKIGIFEDKNRTIKAESFKSLNFETAKLPILKKTYSDYIVHLKLNEDFFKSGESYFLEFVTEMDKVEFIDGRKSSINYRYFNLELKEPFERDLYFKLDNLYLNIELTLRIYKKDEFINKLLMEKLFFGIGYGIVLTAIFYYLAIYFYNREKSNIYYSLTQFFTLMILMNWNFEHIEYKIFFTISTLGFFIFSTLFAQSFLSTKKHTPKVHKFLTLYCILFVIDTLIYEIFDFYLISEFFPPSIIMLFFIYSAFISLKNGFKPALFYIIGWSIIILTFVLIEIAYLLNIPIEINFIYIIQVVIPLESLILAFALSYKMKMLEDEKSSQKEMLYHQSKSAQMGDMIGNIAHQWRQPLTHLSYIFMNIQSSFKHNELTSEYLEKKTKEANSQLIFMSKTIDDFRDFYAPNREKDFFSIKEATLNAIEIIKDSLKHNEIDVEIEIIDDSRVYGYKNEFSQVILIILSNAKDILIEREDSQIDIKIDKSNISITDNGGGIDKDKVDKIFEPYFTTKSEGTGLGLYIAKTIIEKRMRGEIKAYSKEGKSTFTIKLE